MNLTCDEQIDASPDLHAAQGNVGHNGSQMDDAAALLLMLSQPGDEEPATCSGPPALTLPQSQLSAYGAPPAGKLQQPQPIPVVAAVPLDAPAPAPPSTREEPPKADVARGAEAV